MNTLTFHMDRQRTGWNRMESVLTPVNVSDPSFGLLWNSPTLDSVTIGSATHAPHLYAPPLYVGSVFITNGAYGGQRFHAVFAATSNDYVYAINAFDVAGPAAVRSGTILWKKSLGRPTNFGLDGGLPMGILGTPIIDLGATPPTMYVVADATDDSGRAWKVFALFSGAPSMGAFANAGMWGSGGPTVDLNGYVYETTGNSPVGSMDSLGVWGESLLVWNSGMPLTLAGTYTVELLPDGRSRYRLGRQ